MIGMTESPISQMFPLKIFAKMENRPTKKVPRDSVINGFEKGSKNLIYSEQLNTFLVTN